MVEIAQATNVQPLTEGGPISAPSDVPDDAKSESGQTFEVSPEGRYPASAAEDIGNPDTEDDEISGTIEIKLANGVTVSGTATNNPSEHGQDVSGKITAEVEATNELKLALGVDDVGSSGQNVDGSITWEVTENGTIAFTFGDVGAPNDEPVIGVAGAYQATDDLNFSVSIEDSGGDGEDTIEFNIRLLMP